MGSLDLVGIGSMAVDRFHRAPRILGPEEKGILRDVDGGGPVRHLVGGVMLNQLGWAAALGLKTGITGRQPDDENGRFLRAWMDRSGIERHIVVGGSATTVAEIFVDDAGERAIYMAPGATLETRAEHIRNDHADFIRRATTFSTEISQLPLECVREALTVARDAGVQTVLDFDVSPSDATASLGDEATLLEILGLVDLLKPSKVAVAELVPEAGREALAVARALRARFGCGAVVVTDGEAGCGISAPDYEGSVPACKAKPVDTTGAGDAFLGGLLVARARGMDWEEAGGLANACGAACVEQMGAFPEDALAARARVLEIDPDAQRCLGPEPSGLPAAAEAAAAQTAIEVARDEIAALAARFDPAAMSRAVECVVQAQAQGGRVHVTGVGKPEHLARFAASLLSSTGTPAYFLHATEAVHGSLGQVLPGDVVIAISNSGETSELLQSVEALAAFPVALIAVTGGTNSRLASACDVVLEAGVGREGGPLELAPRASSVVETLVLAAFSAELQQARALSRQDYARLHPAGSLGRRARGD